MQDVISLSFGYIEIMPTYDYSCQTCHCEFSIEQSIKDVPVGECPDCGSVGEHGPKRLISLGTSFVLKGDGWAKDGYGSSKIE